MRDTPTRSRAPTADSVAPVSDVSPQRSSVSRRRPRRVGEIAYRYSIVWALILEIALFTALEPNSFFTSANAQSILGSQAVLLLVAIGLTVTLAVNEFDLSIAGMVAFSQVLMGVLAVEQGWPLGLAVLATLIVCTAIGLVTAVLVVRVGVSSFITTLGMGTLLTGVAIRLADSATIPGVPVALTDVASSEFLGLQLVFWYGLAATAALWFVLAQLPLGRWLYFTGANPEAARLNGVPVGRIRGGALAISAIVASIAGILYAGVLGSADPNSGDQFLLPAFAAAFLGATAITPGRFNAWGTFFAVYLVITGIVGISLVTEQTGWITFVFNGAVLIVAVAAQRLAASRRIHATEPPH